MVPSCVLPRQVGGKPTAMPNMQDGSVPLLKGCVLELFAAQAPGLSVMATEPSFEGLIPDKIQELLEVALSPLPCLLHSCFPICPTPGGCLHHGSAGTYLSTSVHFTAFLPTHFMV